MPGYLEYPLNPHRVIAVEFDLNDDIIRAIRIVPSSEAVTNLGTFKASSASFDAVRRYFDTYFSTSVSVYTLESATNALLPHLDPKATLFVRKVRQTLLHAVLLGDTVTYAELASLMGNPRATRAVGQCLAKNPYHIVIPCHRIVSKDPDKFYYSAGSDVKREILKYEANCIHAPMTAQIPF